MSELPTTGPGPAAAPPGDTGAWQQRWDAALMRTYPTPPRVLVRGNGCTVVDADGREYLDLVAGIAVNVLGHAHPRVVDAVSSQVATLAHTSNLYITPPAVALAERLVGLLGGPGRVFFGNSGAEANEAALKLARRTGRAEIVAADGGFHGRTMGALALTGQPRKRAPFEPLVPGVTFVPYGDADALAATVGADTAAVFLEAVLGEGGVRPAPPGYLAAAREITRDAGALLVLDEIQTGMGRTGEWFAHEHEQIRPDVVTLAKGLGGGLPIGAAIALDGAAELLTPGHHGSTFGGNPVAAAAALAVLDEIERAGLVERAGKLGAAMADGVRRLGHPLVADVRSAGLLLGIVLATPVASDVEAALAASGVLVNTVAPDVIRLAPPLVLADEHVETFLTRLPAALDATSGAGGTGTPTSPQGGVS